MRLRLLLLLSVMLLALSGCAALSDLNSGSADDEDNMKTYSNPD